MMSEYNAPPSILSFQFSAKANEYFKIWIVNLILSILTLGIYSAWAKVRTNRYFYGNTSLENSVFEYHATPFMILKGRLIAVIALILFIILANISPTANIVLAAIIVVLSPWAIWRSMQFNTRMISYRNVRFGFYGSMMGAYKVLFFIPFSPIIVAVLLAIYAFFSLDEVSDELLVGLAVMAVFIMYLIVPFVQKLVTAYIIKHRQYGQGKFTAQLSTIKYYMIYLAVMVWLLLFATVAVLLIAFILYLMGDLGVFTPLQEGELEGVLQDIIPLVVVFFIPFFAINVWTKSYLEVHIRNHVLNNTQLDDVLQLHSDLSVRKLFWLHFVNTFFMAVTLGLAYPWTVIRLKKYKIESTHATINGNMAQYINQQQEKQSALGEELGDAFDLDLDLNF